MRSDDLFVQIREHEFNPKIYISKKIAMLNVEKPTKGTDRMRSIWILILNRKMTTFIFAASIFSFCLFFFFFFCLHG